MTDNDPRLIPLNGKPPQDGRFVLYWMDRAQRVRLNHAFSFAAEQANRHECPLLIVLRFGDEAPSITRRQAKFMAEGLQDLASELADMEAGFLILEMADETTFCDLLERAVLAVTDVGHLRHHRQRRTWLGDHARCQAIAVETDLVVPVNAASDKAEYAARTIRPKINRQLERFLTDHKDVRPQKRFSGITLPAGLDAQDWEKLAAVCGNCGPAPVDWIAGGHARAKQHLASFLANDLPRYDGERSDPTKRRVSHLSPYLRFGQISPIEIALKARAAKAEAAGFLEELIVRRELAANWCHYRDNYDRYEALPDWARATLQRHSDDKRDPGYTAAEIEAGDTSDEAFNAAMREMKATGYLHNHLRMYWAKQILRWASSPQYALETIIALNNRYFLDGGDPNSFANNLWTFGLHDRPFQENAVYGTVRPMTQSGLRRKFDVDAYVKTAP
ncbi:deoxyribodipyrimidine photo-lyase [Rhodopseudomonas julia]|uniref:Deoxyribodipyrimidine photo-lyase n=1 Tax=Rhodopseudomonas julia TaxID=200617 RepID=A0ABU0C4U3_9BRAD|nr:deoxyribodipyrimidine photo-lyase [Rhodopseudomonas julia]MDQ0325247.1 deoxyribodipyrimidine photo-lyase [Rhodopseudomonas julia]